MRRRDLGASILCQLYHRRASYLEIILRSLPQVTAAQPLQSGAEGDRTLNLSIANAALSQLSYRPGRWVIPHQSNGENTPRELGETKGERRHSYHSSQDRRSGKLSA